MEYGGHVGGGNESVVDRLSEGIEAVDQVIAEWEPDPDAQGWLAERDRAKELKRVFNEDVDGILDEALEEIDDPETHEILYSRVADMAAGVAVYCHLAGDARGFKETMERAVQRETDDELRLRYDAGKGDPDGFARLDHGRWLYGHERYADAEKVLTPLTTRERTPEIAQAARQVLGAPRAMTSAPSMSTFNGIGTRLYGARDHWPNGSYVATLCFCVLFIPLVPIRAYRVWQEGDGWVFMGIVPLSPFAKMARWIAVAAIALGGVGIALGAHYGSDSYAASSMIDEARALEDGGDREAAIAKYLQVIDEYAHLTDVSDASLGIVRASAAAVKEPATAASLDQIGRVANALPSYDNGSAKEWLVERLLAWAEQIGAGEAASAQAQLAVLEMAMPHDTAAVADKRNAAIVALADRLAKTRPLMALTHYMGATPPQRDKALAIMKAFPQRSPSLWLEAKRHVAQLMPERLSQAEQDLAAFEKLREADDEKQIRALLDGDPQHQQAAAAVAMYERRDGNADEAIAVLEAIGPAGMMTTETHLILGSLYRDAGRLDKAEELLAPFVAERLTSFLQLSRQYNSAADAVAQRVITNAQAGKVPTALDEQLRTANEERQGELIRAHIRSEIDRDPKLQALQLEMIEQQPVVAASLTLGMVKLARANTASGAERNKLLDEAEKAFLSMRGAAEGQPSYHLGLGEVYHRLGKTKEGDGELNMLLGRKDPQLSMEVAMVYRGLGKVSRAREILTEVQTSPAPDELRQAAAYMLSLVADNLDDKEKWLKASDASTIQVKASLIELRGARASQRGDKAAADKAYAESARLWESEATNNPVALNNAAVSWGSRYYATGKLSHLKTSAAKLDESLKLRPEAPLTILNLLETLIVVGMVDALGEHFKVDALSLDRSGANSLVWVILRGDDAEPMRATLAGQRDIRRAVELAKQLQVLAPHRQSGWSTEIDFLKWTRDEVGLERLQQRLAQGQKIDVSEVAAQRRAFERGDNDAVMRKAFDAARRANELRLERAEATGHAPTIAAAEMLAASSALSSSFILGEGDLTQALAPLRSAHERWPHPGIKRALAGSLINLAIANARPAAPALAKAFQDKQRQLSLITLAAELDPQVHAVIGARAEIAEALTVADAAVREGDSLEFYLAAQWAQNAELTGRCVCRARPQAGAAQRPDRCVAPPW